MSPAVEHVFVLMLENRSFDHFFGLSGLVAPPSDPGFTQGATDRCASDPPHEFQAVQEQIAGGAMSGFIDAGMKQGFLPAQVPVITQLAREFVLFDNWFSSMPGPTWPNRFFVHCGSSGGLATSPTQFQTGGAVISPISPFRFQNGSIYDRLDAQGIDWRVYHGDVHPQVLAVPKMVGTYLTSSDRFCPLFPTDPHFSDFASDVSQPGYRPAYTFIEPNYAITVLNQFVNGDSQHPKGSVSAGEATIKHVYEALRNSPIWARSVLLVTWDEHGGFYDRVAPPPATPPGDTPCNRASSGDPGFAFDRLGVRVPALLVSPLAPKGRLGSDLFPGQSFDHTSVIRSVFETFGVPGSLTARDAAAPSWMKCLADDARGRIDASPTALASPAATTRTAVAAVVGPLPTAAGQPTDGFLSGMSLISLDLDRAVSAKTSQAPIANNQPQSMDAYQAARSASLSDPHFNLQLVQYINEVGVRAAVQRLRAKMADAAER